MKRCAVDSGTGMRGRSAPACSLASAEARPSGSPTMRAPSRSAWYSRARLMPSWISVAAIGATISASRLPAPPRRPPNQKPMKPISEIALAMVATIEEVRMSQFLTCASSWPSTPRSSRSVSSSRMPVVTATAACFGERPVAKAFGCGESMT